MENFLKTKGLYRRFSKTIPIYMIVATSFLFALCFSPTVYAQTGTIQIGSGTGLVSDYSVAIPVTNYEYSYTQQIVTAAEYGGVGGAAGNITKIRWHFNDIASTSVYGDWDVYIGHTTKTEFTSEADWVPQADLTQVYGGNIHTLSPAPTNGQWFEITFSTPFNYNGTDNIVIAVHEKTPGWIFTPSFYSYTSTPNSGIVARRDSGGPYNLSTLPNANGYTDILPQLQFEGVLTACSGVPNPGTLSIPPTANVGDPYDVKMTGVTVASGLTYTWQTSIDGGDTWTNVTGYPSQTYADLIGLIAPALGDSVLYKLIVACGADADETEAVKLKSVKEYCVPTTTNTGDYTVKFSTTGGVTNASYEADANGSNPAAYIDLSADATYTITQIQEQKIHFSHLYQGGPQHFRIWVDWNDNGTFSDDEEIFYQWNNGNGPWSGLYAVPLTAPVGNYRMRVRSQYMFTNPNSSLGLTPCGELAYGTTLDFTFVVQEAVACTGVPAPGTANAEPPTANAGDTYSVVTTEFSPDLNLTFQWQKYNEAIPDWEDYGTATSEYANITGEIAPTGTGTEVKYQLKTTCNNSGESNFSNVATFKTGIVYCKPAFQGSGFGHIKKFSTTNALTNITNTTNVQSAGGYGDFTATHTVYVNPNSMFNFSAALETAIGAGFAIWIDWNGNGIFETTEREFHTTAITITASGNIDVTGQSPGTYRMRIMSDYDLTEPVNPCKVSTGGGEAEDYTLVIVSQDPCSGIPDPGTLAITPPITTEGGLYQVKKVGGYNGLDLTYTWQTSIDGGDNWTNVTGYPSSTYADLSGLTAPPVGDSVLYKLTITCDNSGLSETTDPVKFKTSKYCVPVALQSSSLYYVSSITTSGATTDMTYTANSAVEYVNASETHSVTAVSGTAFDFTINQNTNTGFYYVWVDLNDNGVFTDPGENIVATTIFQTSITGTITIPATLPAGSYRVRVANSGSGSSSSVPCGPANYGNYVDFTLIVTDPQPCTGTPDPGTLVVTPTTAIAGEPYDVKKVGGYNGLDLTYTWQTSIDGGDSWTNVTGYPSSTYADLIGLIAPPAGDSVLYKLTIACDNSGLEDTTDPVKFKTTKYCVPTGLQSSQSYYVSSITTSGATTDMTYTANTAVAYVNASETHVVTAVSGTTFDLTIAQSLGTGYYWAWVDWNDNGVFTDPDENIVVTTTSGYQPSITRTITIPIGLTAGSYRVRVANSWSGASSSNPCGPAEYGNYVDFTLILTDPPACSGIPNPGTITVTPTAGIAGSLYDVKKTFGIGTNATGLTYTWQTSIDGGDSWTNVTGYPSLTYAHLFGQIAPPIGDSVLYKLIVACGADADETNVVKFKTSKYCTPVALQSSQSYYVGSITTSGATTDMTYTANTAVAYVNASETHSVTATSGTSFNFTIAPSVGSAYYYAWVDLNDNGVFTDPGENILATTTMQFSTTGTITIPIGFTAGSYRVRVANSWSGTSSSNPCGPAEYGNYVDFTLIVIDPPTCSGIPNPGTLTVTPPTANAGELYNVTKTGGTNEVGLTYTWQTSTDGGDTWTNVTGYPSNTYTDLIGEIAPPLGDSVQYKFIVACGTDADETAVVQFKTGIVYCVPAHTSSLDYTSGLIIKIGVHATDSILYSANSQTGTQGYNNLMNDPNYLISRLPSDSVYFSHTYVEGANTVHIWVDWNKNGIFENDEHEFVSNPLGGVATQTGSFIVPIGTPAGDYRMRLRSVYDPSQIVVITPCNSVSYGSTFDFTLHVIQCTTDAGEIKGPSAVCQGLNITLTSTETEGTHEWQSKQPSIASIDASSGIVSGLTGGTAEIMYILTAANGCKDTAYYDVTVAEPFTVAITDSPSNDSLLKGADYTYVSSGTSGTWSSTNAFIASVDPTSGKVTALLAGGTDIVYTETHTCSISSLKHLTVYEEPSGGGGPEPCPNPPCDINGIDEIDFVSNVSLFPNPATSTVNVEFDLLYVENVSVEIVDLNGKVMYTQSVPTAVVGTNVVELDLVKYANGVYSVIVRSNEALTTKKLVISK